MTFRSVVASLAAGLVLAGCSSAEPTYFVLSPVSGASRPVPAHMIKLRRPGLAGYLDRAAIVSRSADSRLQVTSGERWGEPLGDMIARVLAEDLTQRMTGSSVFTELGAISADPDAVVEIDVQRFDVGQDGSVTLLAQVAVELSRSHTASASRSITLSARPPATSTASLAVTMSGLLGQLADQVAAMLNVPVPPPSPPSSVAPAAIVVPLAIPAR